MLVGLQEFYPINWILVKAAVASSFASWPFLGLFLATFIELVLTSLSLSPSFSLKTSI